MRLTVPLIALALAVPLARTSSALPQGVGSKVPVIELEDYSQTPAKSYDDFLGRAVLIEFFAFWWGPCGSQVGHLNEMNAAWKEKGLSILAVTSEGASETEKWVESKGAEYAYAYDKGGKLARHFGVRGIPHAVLIDATGTVVWKGHPGALEDSTLETAVRGALSKPLWEWGGAAKGVRAALQKRAYKSALDQAQKLGAADMGAELVAAVQSLVKGRVDAMKGAYEKGDFLGAQTAALALQKDLAGLPEAQESAKVTADIAGNKQALEVIKGQQKVAKIRGTEMGKRKELVAAIEALRKIKADYPGTYVETEVAELIKQLNDMAEGM